MECPLRERNMKLIIRRDQEAKTGLLGGHKGMTFILSCRVELTPEERDLIAKYKAENQPLTYSTDREGRKIPKYYISSLTLGIMERMQDIAVLLNNEEAIKEACKEFKILLSVMASFGGEEIIEY
jgi:hypothetical protein